jgi:hypothetical protein
MTSVTNAGIRSIGSTMRQLETELDAKLILCMVYIGNNNKLTIITNPGLGKEQGERLARQVSDAIGNVAVVEVKMN